MNTRQLTRGMFENMDEWANIAGKSKAYSSLNPTLQTHLLPRHIGGWTKPIREGLTGMSRQKNLGVGQVASRRVKTVKTAKSQSTL
jgi:hypothetical protein